MSGNNSTIIIAGLSVDVRELSVSEVRQWMMEAASAPNIDVVDAMLFDDFTLSDMALFTDLSAPDVDALKPSDLRKVVDAIKGRNPHFFAMRGRLISLGETLTRTPPTAS